MMRYRFDILLGALLASVAIGCVTDPYYYDRHGQGYNRPPYNERIYEDRPDDRPPPHAHHHHDEDDKPPTLVCASKDGHAQRCHADFPIRRADIDKRYSSSPCDYGRSWGYDDDEVWVDHGCRARFILVPADRWH